MLTISSNDNFYSGFIIKGFTSKTQGNIISIERTDSFLSDCHGRDHVTHAKLAVQKDGKVTGLHVDTIANLGGYGSLFATVTPTYLYAPLILDCMIFQLLTATLKQFSRIQLQWMHIEELADQKRLI